ncbi:MAG: hypothetical protein ABWY93_18760 [Mycobacterium sp.]
MRSLDDTTGCPLDGTCANCGTAHGELSVCTAQTPVGVYCVTLCPDCLQAGDVGPILGLPSAVKLAMEHCTHLGITADQMGDQMIKEAMEL